MPDGSKEFPSSFSHRLLSSLRFVWESGRGLTLTSIALLFIRGLLPLAVLYLIKLLVDAVMAGLTAEDPLAEFAKVNQVNIVIQIDIEHYEAVLGCGG